MVLLAARIVETRDVSFLRVRQVRILIGIGVLLLIGTYVAELAVPAAGGDRRQDEDPRQDLGHGPRLHHAARLPDLLRRLRARPQRREDHVHGVHARAVRGRSVGAGELVAGHAEPRLPRRGEPDVGLQSEPPRHDLPDRDDALVVLVEDAPGIVRQVVALPAVAAAGLVLLATGSRSGLLALGFTGVPAADRPAPLPASRLAGRSLGGRRDRRDRAGRAGGDVAADVHLMPEKGQIGATSNEMREETLERAVQVAEDYPVFGVGLGNFREVTRQIYEDDFFRPPHNSYLWAMCEGGIFVLAGLRVALLGDVEGHPGDPQPVAPRSGDRGVGDGAPGGLPAVLLLLGVRRPLAEPAHLRAARARHHDAPVRRDARPRGPRRRAAAQTPVGPARGMRDAMGAHRRRGDGAPVTPRLRRLRSSGIALILSARSRSQ